MHLEGGGGERGGGHHGWGLLSKSYSFHEFEASSHLIKRQIFPLIRRQGSSYVD